jgi:putative hemolysin
MDVRMPVLNGLEATRRIVGDEGRPPPDGAGSVTRVLVVTTFDLDDYIYQALRSGASGFILEDASAEALAEAVRVVAAGDAMLSSSVTRRLLGVFARLGPPGPPASAQVDQLTDRETEVLTPVARGRSNAEIAERLVVAEQTVKTHVGRILGRLGLCDRTQAAVSPTTPAGPPRRLASFDVSSPPSEKRLTMQMPWLEIGLVLLLVVINAAFAGSEVALISLREGQLRRLEQEGEQGRLVARLASDPNQFLSTIQIGITLAGFLASAAAAVSLAQPLVPLLGFLGRAAEPVAVVLVTMVLTYLTLVVGELAPKRIALQRPERWARRAARPLAVVTALTRPAVWLLSKSTDLLVRLAGADPGRQREEVTEEEVRDMIATGAVFRPEQRRILAETIEIGERRLSDVLVPRRDVVAIPAEAAVQEAIQTLLQSTHGRAPVYRGDLDDVLGLVTLQDLVGAEGLVADCVRPVLALPESLGVLEALRRLQAARGQLAIVLNEYGGTDGIITVEDLLEELVGEIYDEFDPDVRGVQHRPDGSMVVRGAFPVHDLPDLGVSLPEGSYATVAGLILERLGRIPAEGDAVQVDRWRLEVLAMDRNAISRVRLVPVGDLPA